MEVIAFVDAFHQIATSDDKAFTSLQPMYIIIIRELTGTLMAIGMTKVTSDFTFADSNQCVRHYDVFPPVRVAKVQFFCEKTRQSVRKRTKTLSILNVFKPNSDF